MNWSAVDMPDLTGRRAVVTGVTGGLGFHTALELGRAGAELIVTARDAGKAADSVDRLSAELPSARIDVVDLDLADLGSVERAAERVRDRYDRLDIVVNNAGIMATPHRLSVDGYELQMATNHLGHFAWTARLWPLLAAGAARVVTVSSLAHTQARGLDLEVLDREGSPRRYRRWRAYAESKLANLLFALELDRRVRRAGLHVTSVAAHPGIASTNIVRTGLSQGRGGALAGQAVHQVGRLLTQSAADGAWSQIRAAIDPTLTGGEYVGPSGVGETKGRPVLVTPSRRARDPELADRLWTASEDATGVSFDL